ncbi:MAG: 30S ribosomal protein S20 [Lachnospiraceae bacterium]|nr:30S ribosomal protein S20 [Lachnospiraceae bacterium]
MFVNHKNKSKKLLTNEDQSFNIVEYVRGRLSVSGCAKALHIRYFINLESLEVYGLANIKSAKKRIKVIEKKTLRNKMIKSEIKTYVKKVEEAIAAGDKAAASDALLKVTSKLDKAKSKGVFHKNTAARKVSRLAQAVNKL